MTPAEFYKEQEREAAALSIELKCLKRALEDNKLKVEVLEQQIKMTEKKLEAARYTGD